MPIAPMASGMLAAARLPKITNSRMRSAGMEIPSARPMSTLTSSLMASSVGICPPTRSVRPGAPSSSLMAWYVFICAASPAPASRSTA